MVDELTHSIGEDNRLIKGVDAHTFDLHFDLP